MQILEDNKEADYQTMCSFIGAPKQIAISYVEAMETSELLHDLRTKRKIERIIAGFAAVLIAIWTFAVGVAMANDFIQADGRIEVILNADTNN